MENNNIKMGIWTIHNGGVKGSPPSYPELQIDNLQLWTTTKRGDLIVWDWPVHFAENPLCDQQQAVNLLQAMAIARERQNSDKPEEFPVDIDEQTIRVMMDIIDDRTEPKQVE